MILVAVHSIHIARSDKSIAVVPPGEVFETDADEATRLIKLGAAKAVTPVKETEKALADQPEEDSEEDSEEDKDSENEEDFSEFDSMSKKDLMAYAKEIDAGAKSDNNRDEIIAKIKKKLSADAEEADALPSEDLL